MPGDLSRLGQSRNWRSRADIPARLHVVHPFVDAVPDDAQLRVGAREAGWSLASLAGIPLNALVSWS